MSDQSLSDIWRTCLPWSNSRATWEWRVKAMGDRQTETLRDKWLQQPMQNLQHTKNMFMMLSFSSDHQFWDVLSFVGTFRDFLRFLVFFFWGLFSWQFTFSLTFFECFEVCWDCLIFLICQGDTVYVWCVQRVFFYMLFDCGIFAMHLLKYVILNDCALIVLEDLEDSERVFFVFCMFFFRFLRLCSCLFIFTSLLLIRDLIPI